MENTVQSQILDGLYKALKKQIDFYSSDTYKIDILGKDERSTVLTELGNIHTKLTAFANSDTLVTLNDVETLKAEYNTLISNIDSLKGAKGDKGDIGLTGEKGDKGDKGDIGLTGAKGDSGYSGLFSSVAEPFLFGSTILVGSSISYGVIPGKYLTSSSSEVVNASYSITSFIPVVGGASYKINATFSASAFLCLYDTKGDFIASVSGTTHVANNNVLTIPLDIGFIRCSFLTANNISILADSNVSFKPDYIGIIKKLSTLSFKFRDIDYSSFLQLGKYLNKAGSVVTLNGYNYFKIPVFKGDSFYISGGTALAQRLYKNNGAFFPSSDQSSPTVLSGFIDIVKDGYLEVSYLTSKPFLFTRAVPDLSVLTRDDLTLTLLTNKVFHKNMLCIGDSLTSGANYDLPRTGVSIEECYPYFLNLISGWVTTNAGFSGITTQQYYNNKISNYNGANYDGCIIWLGTNGGLTDTIDADTSTADYLTYSATETGKYCAIIEKLLHDNPALKIYLFSIFGGYGSTVDITNATMKKIADKYPNVYYIDFSRNSRLYPNTLLHSPDNGHFNKIGNKKLAEYAFGDILNTIELNYSDYNYILLGDRVSNIFDNV